MENSETKKNIKETAEQTAIVEAVKVIGNQAQKNPDQDTAVFTASAVDGVVQIAAAGSPAQLVKLLARAINADEKLARIIGSALEAAPMLELFDMLGGKDDGEPCNCPNCTAERAEKLKNVNVN